MADRKLPSEERKTPALNFATNLKLGFPLSETKTLQEDFVIACSNSGVTTSKKLKQFFYEALKIESDDEFQRIMIEPRRFTKDFIMKMIKKNTGKYNFSEVITAKTRRFIKEANAIKK